MKILITGGMGFIGLYLVDYLLKKDNEITVLDNFSNSNKSLIKRIRNKNLKIIEGEIRKNDDILNSIKIPNPIGVPSLNISLVVFAEGGVNVENGFVEL